MMRIALTGSIGMGKSTVAAMFAARGLPLFDADAEVRRLQGPGGALVDAIAERFPGTVEGGLVDRGALAAAALGNSSELAALEAIVHPAVQAERERFIARNRHAPALLFDIPLLFETGEQGQFDKIITVSAPPEIQRQRVLGRSGMTQDRLNRILARQLPDADKRARSDFVIDTGTTLDQTEAQVDAIIACLGLAQGR